MGNGAAMNIGREYRYVWHDLMIELRGPVVDELSNEFNKAWAEGQAMSFEEAVAYALDKDIES